MESRSSTTFFVSSLQVSNATGPTMKLGPAGRQGELVIEHPDRLDRAPFFDIALDLQCVIDGDGLLRDVNPAWERTLGSSHDDLIRRPLGDVVLAADLPGLVSHLEAVRSGRSTEWFECRVATGDGSHRWTRWSPNGSVVGDLLFAVAHDVTNEKRRAE